MGTAHSPPTASVPRAGRCLEGTGWPWNALGLGCRDLLGKSPQKSPPEVTLKADHSSFLLHENENLRTSFCVASFHGPGVGKGQK